MRTLALAAFATALAVSAPAFADAIQIGTAKIPPVFANPSGNTSLVADIGTASRAPVFDLPAGYGQVVVSIGTASHAPVFALANQGGVHLANR